MKGMKIGELRKCLESTFTTERLRQLALAGAIPGAVKRPGKHLRFYDREGKLTVWINATLSKRRRQLVRTRGDRFKLTKRDAVLLLGAESEFALGSLGRYNSQYVRLSDLIPEDMLKNLSGRRNGSNIWPSWRDVCLGPNSIPTIFHAITSKGWAVELVRFDQAMHAADANEYKIFNRTVKRRLLNWRSD